MSVTVTLEDINAVIEHYEAEKEKLITGDNETEIAVKLAEYEAQLRKEYSAKKDEELHDIEVAIAAVEKLKAMAKDSEDLTAV